MRLHSLLQDTGVLLCCFFVFNICGVKASEPNRWAILVAGVSGDPELQQELLKELKELSTVLQGPMQFPKDHVFILFDDPSKDPGLTQLKSTRENLAKVCRD